MFDNWIVRKLPEPEQLLDAEVGVAFPNLTSWDVDQCPAYYLQGIRSGTLRGLGPAVLDKYEKRYRKAEPNIVAALCTAISALGVTGCSVVVPPSSRADARPYADALLRLGIATTDLSSRVVRIVGGFRAGSAPSFAAVRSSMRVVGSPTKKASVLVVVDDVLSSGRSAAATALALRDPGFIDNATRIIVAAVVSTRPG